MMEPKIIIVPFSGHDQELNALEYAFNLGEIFEAHVEVWHISPDPKAVFIPFMGYEMPSYPENLYSEMEKINEDRRKEAEWKFSQIKSKMKGENASFHSMVGNAENILTIRGRISDLVVMSSSGDNPDYGDVMNGILFNGGRPVILVPKGAGAKLFNGKFLIAWNGSREAARAVAFSLPYLKRGKVWVMTEEDKPGKFPLSAEDLVVYLKKHDVQAERLADLKKESSLSVSILNAAKILDAGMVVIGAWSHSRMQQSILGGVTSDMLREADIPVFMAH